MKYHIRSWIGGGTEVTVEGETVDVLSAISIADQLETAAKASRPTDDTKTVATNIVDTPFIAKPESTPAATAPWFGEQPVVTATPTIEDVSEAVKLIVAKAGVPRAAQLLKAHGGARSDLVPAENRAAFIAAAAAEPAKDE